VIYRKLYHYVISRWRSHLWYKYMLRLNPLEYWSNFVLYYACGNEHILNMTDGSLSSPTGTQCIYWWDSPWNSCLIWVYTACKRHLYASVQSKGLPFWFLPLENTSKIIKRELSPLLIALWTIYFTVQYNVKNTYNKKI